MKLLLLSLASLALCACAARPVDTSTTQKRLPCFTEEEWRFVLRKAQENHNRECQHRQTTKTKP